MTRPRADRIRAIAACVALTGCAAEASEPNDEGPSSPAAPWLRTAGDGASQYAYGVAFDGAGDVIVIGEYGGVLDFGTGPISNRATTSGFAVKLGPDGSTRWIRRLGGTGDASAYAITVDARDHVFVGGWFKGEWDGRVAAGETDAYLLELDPNGAVIELRTFGDAASQTITSLAVVGSELIVAGDFDGEIDLGGGALRSAGQSDVFVAAFEGGRHRFSKRFGGEDHDRRPRVSANPDGVYVAGTYRGRIDLGGGPLANAYDGAFVARFTHDGQHVWSKSVAGDGWCFPTSLAASASGSIALGARFTGTVTVGRPLASESGEDALVTELAADGSVRFAERFGGFGQDAIGAVAYDGTDLYVAGELATSLGPLSSAGGADAFVARVSGGVLTWAERLGDAAEQRAMRLALDGHGRLAVVGSYFGAIDVGSFHAQSNGGFDGSGGDVFIASLPVNPR